ncbi:MAG TPA: NlpC/P60 family protein [Nocardioidaceae bacterium]|nr:NlpC/P60 family protein [Nocardioidaceae bacterium]
MILHVHVPVATLWTAPDAARERDAAAVADDPDVRAWADSLDTDARRGLHGRTLSQLLHGEPVDVIGKHDDWVEVVARWQPSSRHERGYPGWVRRAHLGVDPVPDLPAPRYGPDAPPYPGQQLLETARPFLGMEYLWGGTCVWAVDCSGLVHWVLRQHGVMVPRDAHDQQRAATPVALGQERAGDLYFFARPDREVHHVGFVVEPGVMLHAAETGISVAEEPLSDDRRATLVAAGRF